MRFLNYYKKVEKKVRKLSQENEILIIHLAFFYPNIITNVKPHFFTLMMIIFFSLCEKENVKKPLCQNAGQCNIRTMQY